jgi:hypothetical protein
MILLVQRLLAAFIFSEMLAAFGIHFRFVHLLNNLTQIALRVRHPPFSQSKPLEYDNASQSGDAGRLIVPSLLF